MTLWNSIPSCPRTSSTLSSRCRTTHSKETYSLSALKSGTATYANSTPMPNLSHGCSKSNRSMKAILLVSVICNSVRIATDCSLAVKITHSGCGIQRLKSPFAYFLAITTSLLAASSSTLAQSLVFPGTSESGSGMSRKNSWLEHKLTDI